MKKPLIVQKFGGTSVGSIEKIHTVAEHIIKEKKAGNHVVVVASAMSGETDRLLALAKQVDDIPNARELDLLLSCGEQVSIALLTMTLNKLGYAARSLTGSQARIITDNQFNRATIKSIDTEVIMNLLEQDHIVVVAGFQGVSDNGDITTLGRGGSDTSAVTLAGLLKAEECQIFTDVDGVYTCDPHIVPFAKKWDTIDFPSMKIMASKGAKVLHLPCVIYAWENKVPLRVLSTFDEHNNGSLIQGEECDKDICGLAIQQNMARIKLHHHHASNFLKQCQLFGIDAQIVDTETPIIVESLEEDDDITESLTEKQIIIKQETCAKLTKIFHEQILNYEPVAQLSLVGNLAPSYIKDSCKVLMEQEIKVLGSFVEKQSLTLIVPPQHIEKAAHILHDSYVQLEPLYDIHPKQVLG